MVMVKCTQSICAIDTTHHNHMLVLFAVDVNQTFKFVCCDHEKFERFANNHTSGGDTPSGGGSEDRW